MWLHPEFSIQGKKINKIELLAFALHKSEYGTSIEKSIGNFIILWFNDETHLLLNTSGSTGKPKTLYVEKRAMVTSAKATGSFFNLCPNDKILLCLNPDYIAGKMMLVRALELGLDLYYTEPSSSPFLNFDVNFKFTAMVPLQVENSLDNLRKSKIILIGGAPISNNLRSKIVRQYFNCYESFGMTETVSHIAIKKCQDDYFTVLNHINIEKDEKDCLIIYAPFVSNAPIITNDIVEIINKNKFIWKGRFDSVINSGGVKIFPEQLEKKIEDKLNGRFFIGSIPDEKLGSKVVLVIEGEECFIDQSIFNEFGNYEIPKKIIFYPKFIETATQKINRIATLEAIKKVLL